MRPNSHNKDKDGTSVVIVTGNRFLAARAKLQARYLFEIEKHFSHLVTSRLPLLYHDVLEVDTLQTVGEMVYGN